jgi:hypothetical protein
MKLSIEHSKTKRQIDGTFAICGSRADLESLRDQLTGFLNANEWTFGWVTIYSDRLKVTPSTPPIPWDAEAPAGARDNAAAYAALRRELNVLRVQLRLPPLPESR